MRVLLTSQSETDVEGIAEYYLSNGASPEPFLYGFFDAIEHLKQFPDTAVRRPDLVRSDVLFWLINPYWMVLKNVGDTLYVVAVIHCSRRPGKTIRQRLKTLND